jgi:hypothetical protein
VQYQYGLISVLHQLEHILRKTIKHDVFEPNQVIQDNDKQHPSIIQLLPTGNHQSPQSDITVQ